MFFHYFDYEVAVAKVTDFCTGSEDVKNAIFPMRFLGKYVIIQTGGKTHAKNPV
jgi:hypothetical protein